MVATNVCLSRNTRRQGSCRWHPLVSGDPDTVHRAISVKTGLSENQAGGLEDHITWPEEISVTMHLTDISEIHHDGVCMPVRIKWSTQAGGIFRMDQTSEGRAHSPIRDNKKEAVWWHECGLALRKIQTDQPDNVLRRACPLWTLMSRSTRQRNDPAFNLTGAS